MIEKPFKCGDLVRYRVSTNALEPHGFGIIVKIQSLNESEDSHFVLWMDEKPSRIAEYRGTVHLVKIP